jgi:hypothetical protein
MLEFVTPDGDSDIAFLSLVRASAMPADSAFAFLELSAKVPIPGETLKVVGFRFEEAHLTGTVETAREIAGALYVSVGVAWESTFLAVIQ